MSCADGSGPFTIRAHVSGKLVEVNEAQLEKKPQLLVDDPLDCGFIGASKQNKKMKSRGGTPCTHSRAVFDYYFSPLAS